MSVQIGEEKLRNKAANMTANYNAVKGGLEGAFVQGCSDAGMPVGPLTRAKYARGVANGTYRTPDPAKWSRNLLRAMAR